MKKIGLVLSLALLIIGGAANYAKADYIDASVRGVIHMHFDGDYIQYTTGGFHCAPCQDQCLDVFVYYASSYVAPANTNNTNYQFDLLSDTNTAIEVHAFDNPNNNNVYSTSYYSELGVNIDAENGSNGMPLGN